jgi:hypothetical protein
MVVCPPTFLPTTWKGRSFQEIGKLVLGSTSLRLSYLPHFQPHDRLVIYQAFFYRYFSLIHRTSICKTVIFEREDKVDPMPPLPCLIKMMISGKYPKTEMKCCTVPGNPSAGVKVRLENTVL